MSELKNCPHCGNNDYVKAVRVEGENVSPDNFQVVCSWLSGGCGASGGVRRTEAEAIVAWNRRAEELEPDSNLLEPNRCELEETESYDACYVNHGNELEMMTVHILECSAFTINQTVVCNLHTFPTFITIHCVKTSLNRGNLTGRVSHVLFKFSNETNSATRVSVTTVHEAVHKSVPVKAILLGDVQKVEEVIKGRVNTAVGG